MSEITYTILVLFKFLAVFVFGMLYGIGGMAGTPKAIRRYIGPAVLGLFIIGISLFQQTFNWIYLLYIPSLMGALTLPYGANNTIEKIVKRGIYGFATGIASIWIALGSGNYYLFIINLILNICISILFGVWNPCRSARDEESFIGASEVLVPMFMI